MKRKLLLVMSFVLSLTYNAQKVNFSEQFKKENQGEYKIEINEVKELMQIMIAITKSGLENDDMIQQQGQYYKDVLTHFKPYENEKIIKTFDSLMVASIYNYIFLTGNGISYNFKGDKLIKSNVYDFPATSVVGIKITENPVTTYKQEIEDFAKKSQFRKFYKNQKNYYSKIISDYEQNANLGKQWKWLEKNFETKIDSYIIFCSPLVNGLNYTDEFNNNNFRLIYMNLPSLEKQPHSSAIQNEIFNTRVMFTEIDHNYVGTPSKKNKETIDKLFADRKYWVNDNIEGTYAYSDPIKVFDEYMTYAVFILYCQDLYNETEFQKAKNEVIAVMKDRGFPKMQEFTDQLIQTRLSNPNKKIDNWYPEFLKSFEK